MLWGWRAARERKTNQPAGPAPMMATLGGGDMARNEAFVSGLLVYSVFVLFSDGDYWLSRRV